MVAVTPDLLTTADVAGLLNVSARTVRRYIESGDIKAHKLPGGLLRVPRSEVDRLLSADPEGVAS